MSGKRKDYANQVFDKLTAKSFNKVVGKHSYWNFECSCGEIVVRIPTHIKNNKRNSCDNCKSGSNSHAWRGCGEIPHDVYTAIKHSAAQKGLELNVSIEYLWRLFLSQNKRCVFTGFELEFNKTFRSKSATKTASLDRIDSSKGYIEGNLQWVHKDVNKLKKNFSDERFIELCVAIASNYDKLQTKHSILGEG